MRNSNKDSLARKPIWDIDILHYWERETRARSVCLFHFKCVSTIPLLHTKCMRSTKACCHFLWLYLSSGSYTNILEIEPTDVPHRYWTRVCANIYNRGRIYRICSIRNVANAISCEKKPLTMFALSMSLHTLIRYLCGTSVGFISKLWSD